jgi:integrase
MQMFASTVQFSNFGKWGTNLCQYVDENPTGNASIERHGVGTTTSVAAAGGGRLLNIPSGLLHLSQSVTVRTGGRAVSVENLRLREAAPTSVNVTVGQRSREYLTDREVERVIEAAKQNRSGHRDATAILVACRHGLRASELVALRWDDIDLAMGRLHVRRAKSGDANVHPISARESRALRKLLREAPSPYVFISERGAPLSAC